MLWLYRFLLFFTGFGIMAAVFFLVATYYGWDRIWTHLAGPADLGAVQFQGLKKKPTPNQVLVCPDSLCEDDDRDLKSPVYKLSATDLNIKLSQSLENEERLERLDDRADPNRLRFVQRTKLLRFPDTIDVEIVPLDEQRSTIAIYSRSKFSTGDYGVNLARAKRWLVRLSQYQE